MLVLQFVSQIYNRQPSLLFQTLFENFKDVDVADMRSPYFPANSDDLKSAWSLAVPGK